jgi:hypothetical protein
MAGPEDIWAWLQSIMPNQGAGRSYGPGTPTGGAGPQALMPGGGVMGYGAVTPGGPSMGYPAVGHGDGPPDVTSPAAMYAQGGYGGPQAAADAAHAPPSRPFNWLTSTGVGMSAPPGSPSAAPVAYGGPTAAADAAHAPKGPLASASGGIGSDAKFPLKRTAGAPNLGYYQPTTGNARAATYVPFTDPNDPRIFRG